MSKIFFTVGPTQIYPEVQEFYREAFEKDIPSIPHRSQAFSEIVRTTIKELQKLLNVPDNFYFFFLSSATECMERTIESLVAFKSTHFVNGYFAKRFNDIAVQLRRKVQTFTIPFGKNFSFSNYTIDPDSEMICLTLNETSTGVAINPDEIVNLKKNNPDKIVAVDAVTAFPYYRLTFNYVDVAFFSVQKGFGMPAGLGVLMVNKNCLTKAHSIIKENVCTGSFNNFINLAEKAEKYQTSVTPNALAIYVLGRVANMLNNLDPDYITSTTEKKAKLIYDYFDTREDIRPFVEDTNSRSKTTIVLQVSGNIEHILKKLEHNDLIISKGYADFKKQHIRIGNFPMHKIPDVLNLLYLFKKI
ncbi:MAG: aminotransferase class V-fold PLP-dependent enzyme [Ignavibacteria bacterium]